jgi:protein-disulfide isomerase
VAKGKRIRAERATPPPVRPHGHGGGFPTWAWLAIALGIAAVIGGVLVAASKYGASSTPRPEVAPTGELAFAGEVNQLFEGIPQDGASLGRPDAPVTLVEYADLQCPFCAGWARDALPAYVKDYVRPGRLRIEFRPMTFIGADSEKAALVAFAGGEQNKLWNVVELMYRNQGGENSGWVSDDFLTALGRSVPGLDADAMLTGAQGDGPRSALDRSIAQSDEDGIDSTPSFLLGPTGGDLAEVKPDSLDADGLRSQIEGLINP